MAAVCLQGFLVDGVVDQNDREYLEVLFGPHYDVIPALVLTKATDLYRYEPLGGSDALLPVCSGDMLFNLFDEYIGFLQE